MNADEPPGQIQANIWLVGQDLDLVGVPGVGFFSKDLKDAILGDHHAVSDGQVVHGFLDHQSAQRSMEGSVATRKDDNKDTLKGKLKQRNLQDS